MRALPICALLVALTVPAGAQAAQRYAAPTGSGTECSQVKPCSLNEAVGKAKANDEVIVGSGAYSISGPAILSFEATGVYVHGDFSGPPPTIAAAVPGPAVGMYTAKSRLSYVSVTNTAEGSAAIGCIAGAMVERVSAKIVSKFGQGVFQSTGCSIHDSLIRAEGDEAVGLLASCDGGATARNVTIVSSGTKGIGARAAYNGIMFGGNCTLDLRNSIVSGGLYDLQTNFGGIGAGNISVEHSNFDVAKQEPSTTITQGTGNQAAPPLFLDAAAGNYREAAGSPTIDAGANDQLGALDLDGNSRVLGPAADIGAFEFVPPPAPSVPPVPPGRIESLTLEPARFRAVNAGEAIFSARKKARTPIGTTVTYSLSGKATTEFFVERKVSGRRVRGKCVKVTKANRAKKKCAIFKLSKTGFAHSGAVGANRFKFSGRIGGRGLAAGSYRLVANAGGATRSARFTIVK